MISNIKEALVANNKIDLDINLQAINVKKETLLQKLMDRKAQVYMYYLDDEYIGNLITEEKLHEIIIVNCYAVKIGDEYDILHHFLNENKHKTVLLATMNLKQSSNDLLENFKREIAVFKTGMYDLGISIIVEGIKFNILSNKIIKQEEVKTYLEETRIIEDLISVSTR
ncbi:hypothetical protein BN85410400 [Alteracholeplasma palmae J233]|uniref:Uncharacterized protein n=1 Tax=Alteracholeplasma palmae (strain ATCC 49389 / J233) TaxID=1318466 RepID=U4KLC8_ALTPJ|nr:hypothetical protein [Alteracholeplasma palmae]CCV64617.1 hypothetical protein BN85410400 [Alteracholeplasma palmae J233]